MRWVPRKALAGSLIVLGVAATAAFGQDAIITGTDGNDLLTGTPAGESIYGRAGNDVINGAGGNDELDGGPGADVLNGGPGSDSVAYSGATGVSVTLDGIANDGAAGEGDNVGADVEDIFGGDGNDTLIGSAGVNTIDGGDGADAITGGSGKDALFGGSGNDNIQARDGQVDRIDCGDGTDFARLDRSDIIKSCENVSYPPVSNDLSLFGDRRFIVGSIGKGSTVVIACRSGCHPASSPSKALIKRTGVRGPLLKLRFTKRVSGATLEVGVTVGGSTSCTPFRIAKGFRRIKILNGQGCKTVARPRRS